MIQKQLDLTIEERDGERPLRFDVNTMAYAMYCHRDATSPEALESLAEEIPEGILRLGLASVPQRAPAFCRGSRYLLTTDDEIEVQGTQTCGEVEMVALIQGGEVFVGVGSDHCDRTIEPFFYYKPKQMAPRVLGPRVWRYADIEDHWGRLQLKATMTVNGEQISFQDGVWGDLISLPELLELSGYAPEGLVLYCGTVALGPYRFGEHFSVEVYDPVLNRSLRHGYAIHVLQDVL